MDSKASDSAKCTPKAGDVVTIHSARYQRYLKKGRKTLKMGSKRDNLQGMLENSLHWKLSGEPTALTFKSAKCLDKSLHTDGEKLSFEETAFASKWCFKQTEFENQYHIESVAYKNKYLGCDGNVVSLVDDIPGNGKRWNVLKISPSETVQLYDCPYCDVQSLTEDQLWSHCPRFHGRENGKKVCPICTRRGMAPIPVGGGGGFGSHLHGEHGPSSREPSKNYRNPTFAFSIVICRRPTDGRFLLVEERFNQGWWVPAGKVDPGEDFVTAAHRETMEEAGIKVKLEGILRIEYSPYPSGGARLRVIFLASPIDDTPLKSIPDYESIGAAWISYDELQSDIKRKRKKLRGWEPLQWFPFVEKGGQAYPLDLLTHEGFAVIR